MTLREIVTETIALLYRMKMNAHLEHNDVCSGLEASLCVVVQTAETPEVVPDSSVGAHHDLDRALRQLQSSP